MKIVFMGTPMIATPTLEQLLSDGHEIVGVFTQPDRPSGRGNKLTAPAVKEMAQEFGLPVFQPTKIKTPEMQEHFASLNADIGVVVAYGRILPQHLLNTPRLGCLNIHFSLLPKYRGAAPVNWVIANNEPLTGVTIIQMDAGLDTGDILLQSKCWISRQDTAITLGDRLAQIGAESLSETLKKLLTENLQRIPQDNETATLAPILKKEDGLINWTNDAETISCRIRGFQPWPGGYTFLDGARLSIYKASPKSATNLTAVPGTFIESTSDALIIACGEQTLVQIEELQLEGKKKLLAKDFLNGTRLQLGTIFGNE